ncbi:MAG: tetratricopeptide repeat protein [Planctomycetaceae bacterium]
MRRLIIVSVGLVVSNVAVFAQVRGFDFLVVDDDVQVTHNSHVRQGLTWDSVRWALASTEVSKTWHPLPSLSFMLDMELFGLDPGAFHLVNVAWHVAATVLLFLLLVRMTGALWNSAIVAALFAVHPLHVESVAWITERKDVLVAFFWFLTMFVYAGYARRGGVGRYLLVLICFVLAVMSKAMTVTLPFVLLLLDYWPLRRWRPFGDEGDEVEPGSFGEMPPACPARSARWLIAEKLPMFALSAATAVTALSSHAGKGLLIATDRISPTARILHVGGNYGHYLWKTVWPVDLAPQMPHPLLLPENPLPQLLWPGLAGIALVLAITVCVFVGARRRPYLAVGWLWFAGTLFPVSGIVQAGSQEVADRFAYLPHVGLFLAAVWLVADLARVPRTRRAAGWCGAVAIAACAALSWKQTSHWKDSGTLYEHALRVAPERNAFAHLALAKHHLARDEPAAARGHAVAALESGWFLAAAHEHLGHAHRSSNDLASAEREYREAIRLNSRSGPAHLGLASVLHFNGADDEAIVAYDKAYDLDPRQLEALTNLAEIHSRHGRFAQADRLYRQALDRAPHLPEALCGRGRLKLLQGRLDEALDSLTRAIEADPEHAWSHLWMAIVLAESNRPDDAEAHFLRAIQLDDQFVEARQGYQAFLRRTGRKDRSAGETAPGDHSAFATRPKAQHPQ